jgi:hypothetical protein
MPEIWKNVDKRTIANSLIEILRTTWPCSRHLGNLKAKAALQLHFPKSRAVFRPLAETWNDLGSSMSDSA